MNNMLSRTEFASNQQKYLQSILENEDEDSEFEDDSDDEDWLPSQALGDETVLDVENKAFTEVQESSSDSEESETETEDTVPGTSVGREQACIGNSDEYIAKDKTVWKKKPPEIRQTVSHNLLRQRSGPHRCTETLSIADTFKKIMTIKMIDIIIRYTNQNAEEVYRRCKAENPNLTRSWRPLTMQEMYAFIGILICSGANNSNTDRVSEMWKISSYPLYRATMRYNRFRALLRFLCFDNSNTRDERTREDKAAPIRDVWAMLNSNLSKMYKPRGNLTIDEQLYPYRGSTKFTQYIPSKPAKYGIKVWWICDTENSYPLSGLIYTGKIRNDREKDQGERVVKELAVPFKGSGRNITMDNFFTSLPLAKHLLSLKLTITGTLRKNKPYIPKEMAANKSRAEFSSLFGFHERDIALCSYVPKKNKAVILLSTAHCDTSVNDDAKKKPYMIEHYDKYKIGVETMDQMVTRYTTHRRTRRWPLAFFFNVIDVAALAAYIIYYENNSMLKKRTNERRTFLRQLSEELAKPVIEDRSLNIQITRHHSARLAIESMIGSSISASTSAIRETEARDSSGRKVVTGSCHICYKLIVKRRRKTRKSCKNCAKPVCDEHSVAQTTCTDCEK